MDKIRTNDITDMPPCAIQGFTFPILHPRLVSGRTWFPKASAQVKSYARGVTGMHNCLGTGHIPRPLQRWFHQRKRPLPQPLPSQHLLTCKSSASWKSGQFYQGITAKATPRSSSTSASGGAALASEIEVAQAPQLPTSAEHASDGMAAVAEGKIVVETSNLDPPSSSLQDINVARRVSAARPARCSHLTRPAFRTVHCEARLALALLSNSFWHSTVRSSGSVATFWASSSQDDLQPCECPHMPSIAHQASHVKRQVHVPDLRPRMSHAFLALCCER